LNFKKDLPGNKLNKAQRYGTRPVRRRVALGLELIVQYYKDIIFHAACKGGVYIQKPFLRINSYLVPLKTEYGPVGNNMAGVKAYIHESVFPETRRVKPRRMFAYAGLNDHDRESRWKNRGTEEKNSPQSPQGS
jgi:hypothetical protein